MDLFEVESAFKDVIVLQIVLEEVKNQSLPLYHRLVSLTKNEDKRFYVFFNEFRMETYIQRNLGETVNNRNDRAIRKAVSWYTEHLAVSARKNAKFPGIVMISDDRDNLRKAKAEGILGLTRKHIPPKLHLAIA
jgi:exosome complex exonuclease DIS3/RRP44